MSGSVSTDDRLETIVLPGRLPALMGPQKTKGSSIIMANTTAEFEALLMQRSLTDPQLVAAVDAAAMRRRRTPFAFSPGGAFPG